MHLTDKQQCRKRGTAGSAQQTVGAEVIGPSGGVIEHKAYLP